MYNVLFIKLVRLSPKFVFVFVFVLVLVFVFVFGRGCLHKLKGVDNGGGGGGGGSDPTGGVDIGITVP